MAIVNEQTINLASSDPRVPPVEIRICAVNLSGTIKNMIDDFGEGVDDVTIPLQNVNANILAKIVEYCNHHFDNPEKKEDTGDGKKISEWDAKFTEVDQATLFEMILAANYLDIKPLLDLTCKTVANMIIGKTPEEIRKTFNIKNDFTPEEEEKVRKENEWCEER